MPADFVGMESRLCAAAPVGHAHGYRRESHMSFTHFTRVQAHKLQPAARHLFDAVAAVRRRMASSAADELGIAMTAAHVTQRGAISTLDRSCEFDNIKFQARIVDKYVQHEP